MTIIETRTVRYSNAVIYEAPCWDIRWSSTPSWRSITRPASELPSGVPLTGAISPLERTPLTGVRLRALPDLGPLTEAVTQRVVFDEERAVSGAPLFRETTAAESKLSRGATNRRVGILPFGLPRR